MFALEPGENPVTGLHRILAGKTASMETLILDLDRDPGFAVHEFRKGAKRVRAALRLARPGMGETEYRRDNLRYRDLARHFSAARDAVVMREMLTTVLRPAAGEEGQSADIVRSILGEPQDGLPDAERIARIVAELKSARAGFEARAVSFSGPPGFIFQGLRDTADRARRAYREAYRKPRTAEKFHEWRKQVKYLMYQYEILEPAVSAAIALEREDLDHLSELLGTAHDAAMLENRLQTANAGLAGIDFARLARQTRRLRVDNEAAARPHGKALFERPVEQILAWLFVE